MLSFLQNHLALQRPLVHVQLKAVIFSQNSHLPQKTLSHSSPPEFFFFHMNTCTRIPTKHAHITMNHTCVPQTHSHSTTALAFKYIILAITHNALILSQNTRILTKHSHKTFSCSIKASRVHTKCSRIHTKRSLFVTFTQSSHTKNTLAFAKMHSHSH